MEINSEGNADITTMHQDVREAGKWPGDRRIQPVIGALTESPRNVGRRRACTTPRQFVDRAVESAVPKCRPLERPEAVGEDTDQVGSYRLDVPPCAQTRCCESILVKGIQQIGDAASLGGHGVEYLFAIQTSPPVLDHLSIPGCASQRIEASSEQRFGLMRREMALVFRASHFGTRDGPACMGQSRRAVSAPGFNQIASVRAAISSSIGCSAV
jgi:hypothetical protein